MSTTSQHTVQHRKRKKTYSAVWPECVAGRGGNEIASAVVVILNCVLQENPELEKLVLW